MERLRQAKQAREEEAERLRLAKKAREQEAERLKQARQAREQEAIKLYLARQQEKVINFHSKFSKIILIIIMICSHTDRKHFGCFIGFSSK